MPTVLGGWDNWIDRRDGGEPFPYMKAETSRYAAFVRMAPSHITAHQRSVAMLQVHRTLALASPKRPDSSSSKAPSAAPRRCLQRQTLEDGSHDTSSICGINFD